MYKILLSIALLLACSVVLASDRYLLNEVYDWATKADAEKYVDEAKKAGFTILMPVVWHGRGGSWDSEVTAALPEDPWYKRKVGEQGKKLDYDAFQYFLDYANEEGLKVHPYFTVSHNPYDIFQQFSPPGTPQKAFNVHDQEFKKFFLGLVEEFLAKYEVAGIGLDYIRAKGICTTQACIAGYKDASGRDLLFDSSVYLAGGEARKAIQKWNTDVVQEFVEGVKQLMARYQPEAELNVMSHASMEILRDQGADSVLWANEGLIDRIFHMEYAEFSKIRHGLLEKAFSELNDDSKLVVMVGNYTKMNDGPVPRNAGKVAEVIKFARCVSGRDGDYALYAYEYFDDPQLQLIERINKNKLDCL